LFWFSSSFSDFGFEINENANSGKNLFS